MKRAVMVIQAVQEEPAQADYDETRLSHNFLLILVRVNQEWYVVYGACIECVSSLVRVLSYCMHAARAFQLGDGR
jgi:hypothetical protein